MIGANFSITLDLEHFKKYDGVKINYSIEKKANEDFTIGNCGLLFENGIRNQTIKCFEINDYKAFFKTGNDDFPFDIFSAAFFLLSRYEEYLPHEKDMYGRYPHEHSLAFREKFLQLPIINIWVKYLAEALKIKNSKFKIQNSKFIPTYDIDIAWSYKHKGFFRNMGGFFRSPSIDRIQVLTGIKNDPFDTFIWLDGLHQQYQLKPLYFFLLAEQNSMYDKNILPHTNAVKRLITQHAEKYEIGIHPSWRSADDFLVFKKELQQLEALSKSSVTKSRQHYIRFNLPVGYRRLIDAGITDDYSMGYGSINGFRASVASSFYWYDLEKEEETILRIHPFCYMEANAYYEQKFTVAEAFDELMQYYHICKEVNGTLISIWHNHMLGSDKLYEGWGKMYEQFLRRIAL